MSLAIITADSGRYYSKPQLSTALTQGKTPPDLITASAEEMAQQLKADILTDTIAVDIDTNHQIITGLDGSRFPYSKLILACGADTLKAPLKGNAAADVLSINHLYHYSEFRALIQNKKTIAILGMGLIGCEFANDLSNAGYDVHLIAPLSPPRFASPLEIGTLLQTALERTGVHFHLKLHSRRSE